MIKTRFFFFVILTMGVIQINAISVENDWVIQTENTMNDLTKKIKESMDNSNTEFIESAKKKLSTYYEQFKSGLTEFTDKIEKKASSSDAVKEAVKQWRSGFESYNRAPPTKLTIEKISDKYINVARYIKEKSSDLSKNAQGNAEIDEEIKMFTQKQLNDLIENLKSVESQISTKHA
ncbi:uncharacterized protein LOC126904983 [Daktulosphaira vitifoliae]|uniref:uncharacterized protein LOC126904983 n=1 Tax=Daktulosphaira vitifoliae TaxID=58002 RepID=UPI0021A997FF|nr:uncharacterized protein LOC126904983 [Daktulosphaira vitifoliae]